MEQAVSFLIDADIDLWRMYSVEFRDDVPGHPGHMAAASPTRLPRIQHPGHMAAASPTRLPRIQHLQRARLTQPKDSWFFYRACRAHNALATFHDCDSCSTSLCIAPGVTSDVVQLSHLV